MSEPKLVVTEDFTDKFNAIIKSFKKDSVLVGIPEQESQREDGEISNAAILAINEFGSPANNIPPRNVMATGIRNAQDDIADQFKKATQDALSQGLSVIGQYYERAGLIASNSVKKAINAQDWDRKPGNDGPAESTLKAREYAGFKGEKSLIVTGQMRNAITYVVMGDE